LISTCRIGWWFTGSAVQFSTGVGLRSAFTFADVTSPTGFRLGIDFGTTHTVAALARPDGRVQTLLFSSSPLLCSAVYAEPGGRLLTGGDAQRSARLDPARYEPNVKRRIDEGVILLGDTEYPVVDLIAAVLSRVNGEAIRVAGQSPAQTVLTHPAGWAAARRSVLAEAANRAGLVSVSLLPEPLAAAAYFAGTVGHPVPPGSALVVYDFGGGTFDVSVIARQPDGGWRVIADEGLDDVGGLDLDAAIIEQVRVRLGATDPVRWQRLASPTDPGALQQYWQLREEVRAAKEQLSRTSAATIRVPLFDTDARLTREEFEALARPWLERTVAVTASTLFRTGLRRDQVAAVLLVGGSSRIPLAATLLHQQLGVAPTVLDQPELVVAEGSLSGLRGPAAAPAPAPVSGSPMPSPIPGPPLVPAASYPGGSLVAPLPRRRTGLRWALLAGLVVALLAVGTAVAAPRLAGHHTPQGQETRITGRLPNAARQQSHQASPPASPPQSPSPAGSLPAIPQAPSSAPAGTRVVYQVTASGTHNVGSVQYTDQDGTIIHKSGIRLPWRLEFTITATKPPLVLISQRTGGGDNGPVTCSITYGGKVLASTTAHGQYAAPECSG
jgi:hypothetical protein